MANLHEIIFKPLVVYESELFFFFNIKRLKVKLNWTLSQLLIIKKIAPNNDQLMTLIMIV